MTLSSPDARDADVRVWQPADVTGSIGAVDANGQHAPVAAAAATLFEVSPTAGIPEAMLNPARLAAQSAGYVAGWHRGREAGQLAAEAEAALIRADEERAAATARAEIARAVSALHEAAGSLERRPGPSEAEVEQLVLTAAFQLAEAIVGASLADDAVRGRAALHRVLTVAPRDVPVVVHLHPADLAALERAGLAAADGVTVAADPTLAPGDARAVAATTRIDARIATGLDRARRVLLGDGSA